MGKERLQLQDENTRRLERSVEELSLLNDLARAIGASLDFQAIMNTVIRMSCRAVNAAQATVTMVDQDRSRPAGTIVRDMQKDTPEFHLTSNLVGLMGAAKQPQVFNSPADDPRLRHVHIQAEIRNFLCVPLLVGNQMVGILAAYNKRGGQDFDDDDRRLLSIIGAQSAQVLERARLFQIEQDSIKINEELKMAHTIQMRLLPGTAPTIEGYDIHGLTVPAREVGGDYFDFMDMSGGCLGLALGDISGKGVPAALMMAHLQASLRSLAIQKKCCRDCVAGCNALLYRSTPTEKFATLFFGVLHPRKHRINYCNAGHEHPLILSEDGTVRALGTGGIPTGIMEDFNYEKGSEKLAPGEILLLFSDGVTDMVDSADIPFGQDRLLSCLRQNRHLPAEALARRIMTAVQEHAGSVDPLDDLTLMVVRRRP